MTIEELRKRIDSGEQLNIIDVREKYELSSGMIKGAENIPLSMLTRSLNKFNKDKEYIIVCQSGARSQRAAAFLNNLDLKAVNLAGGMEAWKGELVN